MRMILRRTRIQKTNIKSFFRTEMNFIEDAKKYTFFSIILCRPCPLLFVDNFLLK